jgi:hypothetical protein
MSATISAVSSFDNIFLINMLFAKIFEQFVEDKDDILNGFISVEYLFVI